MLRKSCQIVPSGPGFVTENNLRLFTTLLYRAKRRISLTSPYFVPDESLLYAVTSAVQRGIPVELFVSEQSDQFMVGHAQASYYRALLEAGVTIYLYPPPWVLHSKFFSDRRRPGGRRLQQHGHAVVRAQLRDLRHCSVGPEITACAEVEDNYRALSGRSRWRSGTGARRALTYVDNVMRLTAALQ